jgi:hypothetical protein
MQRASAQGKEHALHEGIAIAREMFQRVRTDVQGLQVSAPFGRVEFALQVFDGIDGIRTDVTEPADAPETLGFSPPSARRTEPLTA